MKRFTMMAVVCSILLPTGAAAQRMDTSGLVRDERGEWRAPTHATALAELMAEEPNPAPAIALLRQTHATYSSAVLMNFADEMVRVILEGSDEQARNAKISLLVAGDSRWPNQPGTRYAGTVDAFVKLYESYETSSRDARLTLLAVERVGGTDYLVDLLDSVDVPPPCQYPPQVIYVGMEAPPPPENPCPNVSVWCDAARALLDTPYSPDQTLYRDRCVRMRI